MEYHNGTMFKDTRYVRSGCFPLQERSATNAVTREYAWGRNKGGGIGGLLHLRETGQSYSYVYDGKGSVTAVLDASQASAAGYGYDSFGVPLSAVGHLDQPFRFSTKPYDPLTGLSYFGRRFYSPPLGRWLSRDPIGEQAGLNLYAFVGNDPVNTVDPLGLQSGNPPGDSCKTPPNEPPGDKQSPPKDPPPKDPRDLNGDGVYDDWDKWVYILGRILYNLPRGLPPFMPNPPGFGDDGPGSNDDIFGDPGPA